MVDDPKAKAQFGLSSEVLKILRNTFSHYMRENEATQEKQKQTLVIIIKTPFPEEEIYYLKANFDRKNLHDNNDYRLLLQLF